MLASIVVTFLQPNNSNTIFQMIVAIIAAMVLIGTEETAIGTGAAITQDREAAVLTATEETAIGELYQSFVRKRALVKYQSQSVVDQGDTIQCFTLLKKPSNFEKFKF